MFARIKKSGRYQYLQIVENRKVQGKVSQRVIATVGRLDELHAKGGVETLIRSLARFSETTLLILSGRVDVTAQAVSIGPALIFERLWCELGLPKIIGDLLAGRKFEFDMERAIFLAVLHRLFVSGFDRSCIKWRRDYAIAGVEGLALHQVYRAMAFLGETLIDQNGATPFAPRCTKDIIEEGLFDRHRHLFTGLDLVFFDTTSIYFEGAGGESLGRFGHSKDHRQDRRQMVVGAVLDDRGQPICCEMWPGNTAEQIALKYKELWQVEQVFRDIKSVLDTRPIFHKRDETIRGHVFCSFLALLLRKELDRCLDQAGWQFEWEDIKRDLQALQEVTVEESGRQLAIRTASVGTCGKVFQAVRLAMPPTIREV